MLSQTSINLYHPLRIQGIFRIFRRFEGDSITSSYMQVIGYNSRRLDSRESNFPISRKHSSTALAVTLSLSSTSTQQRGLWPLHVSLFLPSLPAGCRHADHGIKSPPVRPRAAQEAYPTGITSRYAPPLSSQDPLGTHNCLGNTADLCWRVYVSSPNK